MSQLSQRHLLLISLVLASTAWGCQQPAETAAAPSATGTATAAPTAAPPAEGEHAAKAVKVKGHAGSKGKEAEGEAQPDGELQTYPVPFAWESSQDEALARTRAFLLAANADNAKYRKEHPGPFFDQLAAAQAPRVTVLTSAEPALQSAAFDLSAEGDVYMVRNLGNQLGTNAGAVDYGVRELHTPLLMVLGHTGSEAIRMALRGLETTSPWMKEELEPLELPEPMLAAWKSGGTLGPKAGLNAHISSQEAAHMREQAKEKNAAGAAKGKPEGAKDSKEGEDKTKGHEGEAKAKDHGRDHGKDKAHGGKEEAPKEAPLDDAHAKLWADAVVANVNRQVELALERYAHEVVAGHLTVVGAVLDIRNDLHHGPGALNLINVNGETSPETLGAVAKTLGGPVNIVLPPKLLAEQRKGLKPETTQVLEKLLPHSTRIKAPR